MPHSFLLLLLLPFLVFTSSTSTAMDQQKAQARASAEEIVGLLVVVNKTDNSISIIDTAQQKVVNTLPTGKGPHELVVSQNGKWAVSTDFVGGDSLTVFDIANQSVARTIKLDKYPGPHGIRFLNDQQHVAFTSGKSQHLVIANIFTGEVTQAVGTKQDTTHMLAISEKEDFAYTTNIRSNTISKISLNDFSLVEQIPSAEMPEAINITRDGKEIWYGGNKAGLVRVISADSHQTLAQFDDFSFPYRVLFSHDEKVAMVPDFRNHDIRFFDVANKTEIGRLALESEAGPQGITLHPSLDVVFLSLNLKNKIVAIDIHTQEIIAEYPTGNNPDGVGFIPLK